MKHTLHTRANYALFLMLFFCVNAFAQLPNFTLSVTPTAQTCLGNGSLAFTVSGNNPAATMSYAVYLLPNTTTPVTTTTSSSVGGLVAGNYQVIATQSMGAQSNTSTANATIGNNVVPLAYTLQLTNVRCGNDGVITVQVTGGTAVSYEILSGPVTAPSQTSNVFNNLPIGTYQVRVYDNCGEAVVTSVQLIQLNPGLTVSGGSISNVELPSCNTIVVLNNYVVGANLTIFYPLTVQYTVFPPGGGTPTVVTGTAAGNASNGTATATIPFYYDQQYTYNVVITDACGNTYVRNNNTVNAELSIAAELDYPNCTDQILKLTPSIYRPPYTISFPVAPAGFNPSMYNASHPTFSSSEVFYGDVMPDGNYTVSITDACGHTASTTFTVEPPDLNVVISGNVICGNTTGSITMVIQDRIIEQVIINDAPDEYTGPADISSYINEFGALEIDNMPIGLYDFTITDACGNEYDEVFLLAVTGGAETLTYQQRPGCANDEGSVRISVANSSLTELIITAAPQAYIDQLADMGEDLPYNATANIAAAPATAAGVFFMNGLPEGQYTFTATDACGIEREEQYVISGYEETQNVFTVVPLCGAFHLQVNHTANTVAQSLPSFFLQRFNPITNTWGHPETNVAYPEGTLPTITNSRLLNNNALNLNVQATGDFRVIKVFYVFSNGSSASFRCQRVIENFTFNDAPEIVNAYSFPCGNDLNEVVIEATGVAPLTYSITEMNGDPFTINNGTSNLFSGLETATYNFRVTDNCGNIRNIQYDINALEPAVIEEQGFCEGEDSALVIDQFTFLEYEWYEQSNPSVILSTSGVLEFPAFSSATDAGVYVLQITYPANPDSCLNQTIEYPVDPNALPNAGADNQASLCNEGAVINLNDYLVAPFDADGTWAETTASGALTGNQFATDGVAEGTYTFTYTVNGACSSSDDATVTIALKNIPDAPVLPAVATVCETETVQLTAETVANATYHWNGPNGFESAEQNPVFANAAASISGMYSAYVTVNGCVSPIASVSVTVNPRPQFVIEGNLLLCDGQTTQLSVAPSNFTDAQVTYAWYQNGQPMGIATAGIQAATPADYEVVVTFNGCDASQAVTVAPNLNAFTFELEAGCVNENYIISVINLEGAETATYSWSGPNGYSYTGGPDADISELAAGEYTVTVNTPDGCSVEQSIDIDNTFCKIPKGISPNGDQYNNNFDLSNLEVQHLVIFNRYGLKVYEANNYINEWYGQSDKGELPTGAYYYVATLSAGMQKSGWVYLQREVK